MPQTVVLRAKGLYSFPNALGSVPAGGLIQADNIVINRDETIEPRRGFAIYGNAMGSSPTTDIAKQLAVYKGRIIRHFGSTLQFDSNGTGTFSSFSGSLSEPEAGLRIKAIEANGNFYVTSSTGVRKISAASAATLSSASIGAAGGIKALDNQVSINTQPGFLSQNSKVAYKVVWGINDANNNLILGSPSETVTLSNPLLSLLIPDFNKMLQDMDVAATLPAPNSFSDTNYFSTYNLPTTASVTALQANMSGTCSKLDSDSGHTTFGSIKAAIDALTFSDNPTAGQLVALQTQFDAMITTLNSLIGAGPPVRLNPATQSFTLSTQSATANLTITVPQGITTNHFYQVYRTPVRTAEGPVTLDAISPGEEFQLAYEDNPTSGEISSGTLTIHDVTPESFLGAFLYTNPNSGEGILQANEIPPKAKDIAVYKNYTFYANTETKYRRRISLLSVSNLTADVSTFLVSRGVTTTTYTFSATEDVATRKVKISTAETPAQQVDETARSLVRVINRNASEVVYAYYLSGPGDVPGLILFESRSQGGDPFYFNVGNSSYSDQFSPQIPTTGQSVISDNEVSPNRIYYSKVNQPEAVPIVNYFDVGPKDKKIQRIVALRESLFVFKEEGIYRVSGDSAPFVVTLFDSSTLITAPDTAAVLNNQIYLLSTQGVAQVSDTGVSIISRPIEGELIKLNSPAFPAYETASFGIAYESDRNYFLWTVTDPSDTVATRCFRYNTFTNAWYNAPIAKTCGVVNPTDDKLYLGAADTNFIERERKNFDRTDHADREYDFNLSAGAVSGTTITLPSVANVSEKDAIVQIQNLTISQLNRLLMKLDMDSLGYANYYSTLGAMPGDNLRNKLTDLANKLDTDTVVNDSNYAAVISGFGTSFADTQAAFNVIIAKLNLDIGVRSSNYLFSTGTVTYETVIRTVNRSTNRITIDYIYPFIAGPLKTYENIPVVVQYAPQTFGDVSMLKQVTDATVIYERSTYSTCTLSFASDLNPGFAVIPYQGSGTGIYGSTVYGSGIYGGAGNSAPFRTYVPRDKQRCRFLNLKFEHGTAREDFAVFGISMTVQMNSTRAYK